MRRLAHPIFLTLALLLVARSGDARRLDLKLSDS